MNTILFIDDDAILRETIEVYLEDSEYNVLVAENGEVGLEILKSKISEIDVIIVDLRMPGISGYEFIEQSKSIVDNIPIIVLSGVGSADEAMRAINLGANDFLTKPIDDFDILIHSIENNIEKIELIKENQRYKEQLEQKVDSQSLEIQEKNKILEKTNKQLLFEIEERKKKELKLIESEAKFRTLAEQLQTGILIVKDRIIVYFNEALLKIFSVTYDELYLKNINDISIKYKIDIMPFIERFNPNTISLKSELNNYETSFVDYKGQIKWINVFAKSMIYNGGLAMEAVVVDITDSKKYQIELQNSQEIFRQLTENSGDLFWVYDIYEDKILYVNNLSEKFWNLPQESFIYNFMKAEKYFVDKSKFIYDRLNTLDQSTIIEYKVNIEEEEKWYRDRIFPIFDFNNNIYRVGCITTDITEEILKIEREKKQQEQLIQAEKLATLGTLVSGVAHEINNPNNYVMFNSSLLKKFWEEIKNVLDNYNQDSNGKFTVLGMPYSEIKNEIPHLIDGISSGSNKIMDIVKSLKDYARKDFTDTFVEVNINEVVKKSIELLNNKIMKSTNNFIYKLNERDIIVSGIFNQLEQVVINLIDNSLQAFGKEKGDITIITREDEKYAYIEVIDDGCGISDDVKKNIFDPFFTTKRDSGGTGLGLSISYNILKKHKGNLEYISPVKDNKGTKAIIKLPKELI